MSKAKCARCRKDKVKCFPSPRVLPHRCDRCIKYNYSCSESLTIGQAIVRLGRVVGPERVIAPPRLKTVEACVQEMGDLTSLLEVIKKTKSLQRLLEWSYSTAEAVKLRTRLEDTVHESAKRAQQCEVDGLWREAEYLWGSIMYYVSADRLKEIRNALMEVEFHPSKYKNKLLGLFPLVTLHEKLGGFPRAEHELELLIARSHDRPDAEPGQSTMDLEIKTLIRLYGMFQERVQVMKFPDLRRKLWSSLARYLYLSAS